MIHLLLPTFIFYFFSCGDDPILNRASNVEAERSGVSDSKEQKEKITIPAKVNKSDDERSIPEDSESPKIKTNDDQITVSGTIAVADWSGKPIRIDVFDGDQQAINGPRPSVVKVEYQNKPGVFSISLPKSEDSLWIGAYIDEDGDGKPGPKDPSGWYIKNPVSAEHDLKDIQLVLNIPQDLQE